MSSLVPFFELDAELVKVFVENEKQILSWLDADNRLYKEGPNRIGWVSYRFAGVEFCEAQIRSFIKHRAYYTSPLYKALL